MTTKVQREKVCMFSKMILLVFTTQLVGVPHLLIEEIDFTVKSVDSKGPPDLHWNCFKAINIWGMSGRETGWQSA